MRIPVEFSEEVPMEMATMGTIEHQEWWVAPKENTDSLHTYLDLAKQNFQREALRIHIFNMSPQVILTSNQGWEPLY